MTVTFPALTEIDGKLEDRRKKLALIFEEAGPDLDMSLVKSVDGDSAAKVAAVTALNDEMSELGAERTKLLPVLEAAERNAKYSEDGKDGGFGSTESGGDDAGGRRKEAPTFADQLFKSGAIEQRGTKIEIDDADVKATFITSAGWAPQVQREARVVDFATRPIELLDFIPTVNTTASSFTYMEETTFTNAAVETGEGLVKPEAALALTERTWIARKIAVFLPVTDEQLEDVPAAKEYINRRLGFMVRQRLSGQIVAGLGTGILIRGILNVVGIQTQAKGADPTPDAVYKAMTKVRVTGQAEPDAYVTHPNDWQDVRLLRTVDGIYIWGSPSEAGPERIWGLQVIQAQAMTENTGVVGAWRELSTLYVRKGLTVEVGYNADDWTLNKQTVRAEMRAAPVFWRPAGFCTVTGV